MKNDPEINRSLQAGDLFTLFSAQLKKDFEGAGQSLDLKEELPRDYELLRDFLSQRLSQSGTNVQALLYRIDISENQVRESRKFCTDTDFERTLAELIIKRVLQKVIIKKNFSGK